jgi:hypothetical protein
VKTLKIFELLRKRALVNRGSARAIGAALADIIANDDEDLTLDFQGVDAVSPSFVDETLAVVDEAFQTAGSKPNLIRFVNPPTRLSAKFAAVGRAHRLQLNEAEDGAWVITAGLAPRPV